ncbi:MAG TPA: 4a-hydroxytetrahydrobiopterin dehydratase [Mycobacteriales bacterium]|jgi:4a-hydroxytetrahydrobiopterin dehydratase
MARSRLSDDEIDAALVELPGWTYDGHRLERTVTLGSFADAIRYVNAVAAVAQEMDHHPDIDIRYRDVTIACWTHTTGGVTDTDVELARRC